MFEFTRPRLPIWRIGEHKVKLLTPKLIGREGGAVADIFRVFTFDHHIGLADGVGLVIDLFAVEIDIARCPNASLFCFDKLLRLCEHPATTTRRIVDLHHRRQLLFHRVKDDVRHQLYHLPWGKMLPCLFIVLFVKLTDQLLKDIPHPQVAQRRELPPLRVISFAVG